MKKENLDIPWDYFKNQTSAYSLNAAVMMENIVLFFLRILTWKKLLRSWKNLVRLWQFSLVQVKADFYAVTSYHFKTLSLPEVLSFSEPSTSPYLIIADSYKIHATRKWEAAETSS